MRLINGESARDKILFLIRYSKYPLYFARRSSELSWYSDGYIKGLRKALEIIDSEKTIGTIIGENNLNKLSIKEREHHVQQKH